MALFGRRRRRTETSEAAPAETQAAEAGAEESPAPEDEASPAADAPVAAKHGPWDVSEVSDALGRVDLGAVRVPGVPGMALRMELDRQTRRIIAANVTLGQSNLQLQAFAAPRTAGIWDDIRTQIAASITAQGGAVQEGTGPFGKELLALLPVRDPQGNVARRPARFLGVDGPRWFLRGVLTGAAVTDRASATDLERYFSQVVVVRGSEPRPPSELLTLTMPGRAPAPEPSPAQEDILTRGPEITEVR